MIPYQLSWAVVQAKCQEYYNNKKLTAQHPDPAQRICTNIIGEYRCAVAACYPDEVIQEEFGIVEQGVRDGYLIPPEDPLEWARIVRLQHSHDFWASSAYHWPDNEVLLKMCKESFDYRLRASNIHL